MSEATSKIIEALVKAQKEIKPPVKDRMGQFKNKYATLDAVYESCREVLAKNGMTLSHDVERVGESFDLITTLYHTSGEKLSMRCPICVERTGPQGFASALTYARRYGVCSLLALPADDDDDAAQAQKDSVKKKGSNDTSSATPSETITAEQQAYLDKLLAQYEDKQRRLERAMQNYGVKSPLHFLRKDFNNVIAVVRS